VVVFEVQENSDVTFRLYDWDQLDPGTGQPRPLQTDQAIACIDFQQGAIGPVTPAVAETTPILREILIQSAHFGVTRITSDVPFVVGETGAPRVLVCLAGNGQLEHAGSKYPFRKGDVLLLAAEVGACSCQPRNATSLLELCLPEVA
jgi:mannose-6-phosphate isomerase